MGHILSFQHYSCMRRVDKTFKKCFDRNQVISMRSMQKINNDHNDRFPPDIKFDESLNRTFVVHPTGDPLAQSVQSFGAVIPWTGNLTRLIENEIQSGDRILIQDGEYEISMFGCSCRNKVLQIIGIGQSVNIMLHSYSIGLAIDSGSKLLLQNVKVTQSSKNGIYLNEGSKLWMKGCIL